MGSDDFYFDENLLCDEDLTYERDCKMLLDRGCWKSADGVWSIAAMTEGHLLSTIAWLKQSNAPYKEDFIQKMSEELAKRIDLDFGEA